MRFSNGYFKKAGQDIVITAKRTGLSTRLILK